MAKPDIDPEPLEEPGPSMATILPSELEAFARLIGKLIAARRRKILPPSKPLESQKDAAVADS